MKLYFFYYRRQEIKSIMSDSDNPSEDKQKKI